MCRDTPFRSATEQKFKVHGNVWKLLLLRVLHAAFCLCILLKRNALLVPVDGLALLLQRSGHTGAGARLLRQVGCWLMILIKSRETNPFSLNLGFFAVVLEIFAEPSLAFSEVRVIRDQLNRAQVLHHLVAKQGLHAQT